MKLENVVEPQWDHLSLEKSISMARGRTRALPAPCFAGLTGQGKVVEGQAARGMHLCAYSRSSALLLQPQLKTQQKWFAADSCLPARGAEGMTHNSKVTVCREGK